MESLIRRRMQSLKKLTDNGKKTISIIQLQGYVQNLDCNNKVTTLKVAAHRFYWRLPTKTFSRLVTDTCCRT